MQTYTAVGQGRTESAAKTDCLAKAVEIYKSINRGADISAKDIKIVPDSVNYKPGDHSSSGVYRASFYVGTNGTPQPTKAAPGTDYTRLEKQVMNNPF